MACNIPFSHMCTRYHLHTNSTSKGVWVTTNTCNKRPSILPSFIVLCLAPVHLLIPPVLFFCFFIGGDCKSSPSDSLSWLIVSLWSTTNWSTTNKQLHSSLMALRQVHITLLLTHIYYKVVFEWPQQCIYCTMCSRLLITILCTVSIADYNS